MESIESGVKIISEKILKNFEYPQKSENPVVLFFGGFQGSGKTTIIEKIRKDLNLAVVSPDEIRDVMFKDGYVLDDRFRLIVEETTKEIFKHLYEEGYSLVLDNNMTPARLKEVKTLMLEENKHKLITVCLRASTDELEKRLESREEIPGKYKGTVDELHASLQKYGENDEAKYDEVFDTEKMSADEIAEELKRIFV